MDNIIKKPTRKGYSSHVKFQAVMEVIKGKPVGEVARLYGFHPTLFPRWKKQFEEKGPGIFEDRKTNESQHSRTLTIRGKEIKEEELKQKVIKAIEDNPAYGYRRLIPELKKQGVIINHKKLLPLLKKWGLNLKRSIVKKFKGGIDNILSFLGSRVNLIKKLSDEESNQLGRIVFTDFTEIIYNEGKNNVYLIPYLENKTKEIISYVVSGSPTLKI